MTAITVVITTHNLEQHIGRCLQELFDQTMQDFDVLLVDDASTDGTTAIVEEWRKRFGERLRIIFRETNLGRPARTRNVALESGKIWGDYVLFLDGDDHIEGNMLERMLAETKPRAPGERSADVVICAYDRIDSATGRAFSTEMRGFPEEIAAPPSDDTLAFINPALWNKLWRRELVGDLSFPDIKIGEEVVFAFNACMRAQRIRCTDAVLVHYLVHPASTIANTTAEEIEDFARELLLFHNAQTGVRRELAGFLAFLHIGLSMALRAADNPKTNIAKHIAETETYFSRHYGWFRNNRFLRFSSLRKRGMKGLLLWLALQLYKRGLFGPVLGSYRLLGCHIKF